MGANAGTCLLACLPIAAYLGWVWARQRRLTRRLRELQAMLESEEPRSEIRSKAA